MTCFCMPSISVRYSLMETGSLASFNLRKKPASMVRLDGSLAAGARCADASLPVMSGHEHQPFEQVHILLVLEQCAMQWRDDGLAVLAAQRVDRDIFGEPQLPPVEQAGGGGV